MNNLDLKQKEFPGLRIGVSSCLLGEKVRYNSTHVRDVFLLETLGHHVEWVPVCPEVEIGMGTPREAVRLVGIDQKISMVAPKSGIDYTEEMQNWTGSKIKDLLDIHGYVLMKNSPSCGLFRVKVYDKNSIPTRSGRGVFAKGLTDALPLLPVEENGRLHDHRLRENFIERIFAFKRWQLLINESPKPSDLVTFHTSFKCTLMAHHPNAQTELGRIVARSGSQDFEITLDEYGKKFMSFMSIVATPKTHTNVLHHLMGFLKNYLDSNDKVELLSVIEDYRVGEVPLVVPITLLKHHFSRNPLPDWVKVQVYLNPYPKELSLRNHV